ncbi:MAG: PEP-utilizing enzyme [Patescibacteria group bacterium]
MSKELPTGFSEYKWYLFEKIPQCPLWFVCSPLVAYVSRLHQLYDVGYFRGIYLFKDGDFFMYKVEGELEDGGRKMLEKDKQDKQFLFSILDESDRLSDLLISESEKMRDIDVEHADQKKLGDIFENIYSVHEDLWIRGQAINLLEHGYSLVGTYLRELLQKDGILDDQIAEVINLITTPENFSHAQREEQELLALSQRNYLDEDILRHWEKWAWLGYNWLGPVYEKAYFQDRIELLCKDAFAKELFVSEEEYRTTLQEQKQKLHLSEETWRVAHVLARIVRAKSLRVDASWTFYWIIESFLRKIGKDHFLSFKQVQFLKPEEMIALLRGESVDVALSNRRQKAYAIFFEEGKMTEYYGETVVQMFDILESKLPVVEMKNNELRGEVGSPGIATGQVKIVNTSEDITKMCEGDVLVSHTTNPRLVPAMKIACAIVADVGGATSHAAIIARELKKPCVVGTKSATKVLKDGDTVEVDAIKGIVRILSS